jgi:hypothetical protein
MTMNSPFGQRADEPELAVAGAPVTQEKNSRTPLIAIGATALALALGAGGFLLLSGDSDTPISSATSGSTPSRSQAAGTSPALTPTPLPTESTVNARNPFLSKPTPTPTPTVSTTAPAVSIVPTAPVVPVPASPTAMPTPTVTEPTVAAVTVFLARFDEQTGKATFKVLSPTENGTKSWNVELDDRFGKPWGNSTLAPFKYDGVGTLSGTKVCPMVKYVDAASARICQGEVITVQ